MLNGSDTARAVSFSGSLPPDEVKKKISESYRTIKLYCALDIDDNEIKEPINIIFPGNLIYIPEPNHDEFWPIWLKFESAKKDTFEEMNPYYPTILDETDSPILNLSLKFEAASDLLVSRFVEKIINSMSFKKINSNSRKTKEKLVEKIINKEIKKYKWEKLKIKILTDWKSPNSLGNSCAKMCTPKFKCVFNYDNIISSESKYQDFSIDEVGLGLQRFFFFILKKISSEYQFKNQMKENNKPYFDFILIIFEEPELFLHPQQIEIFNAELKKISKEENKQVVITTHSPIFLSRNLNNLKSLFNVLKTNFKTKNHQIKKDLKDLPKLDSEKAISLFQKNIIICEGVTDKKALTFLLDNEKNPQNTDNFKNINIYILEAGGKSEIPKYLLLLHELKLNWFLIYDRDDNDSNNKKFEKNIQEILDETLLFLKKILKYFHFRLI